MVTFGTLKGRPYSVLPSVIPDLETIPKHGKARISSDLCSTFRSLARFDVICSSALLSVDFLLTDAIPFNKNSYIFQRAKSAMTSGVGGLSVFEQSKSLLDIDMTQCIRSDL